jgi:pSer/pThr/pTyr-binding forkhead associated (FHA) protein
MALIGLVIVIVVLAAGVIVAALLRRPGAQSPAVISSAPGPRAELVLPGGGRIYPIGGVAVVLGRNPGSTVVLPDPQVSGTHARITAQGNVHLLEDLGSRNGTFVNGTRITGPTVLRAGDRIVLGDTNLVFRIGAP